MLPDIIEVIIPAQQFSDMKYGGYGERCYLEDALDKIGHTTSQVNGYGETCIGPARYKPKETFNYNTVETAFSENKDIKVILIKQ